MPTSLFFAFLMGQTPMELFTHGGPIMWPILIVSFLAITVVVERTIFLFRESSSREPEVVEKMLEYVETRDTASAVALGAKSSDYVARILVYALTHKEHSLPNAFMRAANRELARFQQGMAWLDTCITAAPLLGLLGTVTGMMATFSVLSGGGDLSASTGAITGGVGEALIATACGLVIAILGLFPYNVLSARIEAAKHDISDASNALEVIIKKADACNDCPATIASIRAPAAPSPRA
ncbi:MotA/TolQ/ExbB proton channel family protein [Rariglobus hedericola]|uniref:MotA/TolQ/ExbB proton channel family protein n=1 Tax=Rariglobus hedericola TaxID=2597822 RepID=A0A556QNV6_9BACT|nr:MotA/TolQ/ExbB proton channel family protein [Rariglobus hedericola]TSJ78336.1 MotA/TolQ/ExbB proton channel family protein [Rariglobus hedericola]